MPLSTKQKYYKKNRDKVRSRQKEWYEKNKIRIIAEKQAYAKRNPKKILHWNLAKYGVSADQFEELVVLQDGKCAVCGGKPNGGKKRLCVDHNHTTGKLRGLLCDCCNRGLGLLKDNPNILEKAIAYLRSH